MAISEAERARLRAAWAGYCDALAAEGAAVTDGRLGDARDAGELAECLRSVARIGIMSMQQRLDFNDPDFPLFFRALDDRFRFGGPDTNITYFMAALRGDAAYRVRGNNFGRTLNIGRLWADGIETDEDGTFEIAVSAESAEGNWTPLALGLQGDCDIPAQYPMPGIGLTVRRYDWDWAADTPPGWLSIARVDADAAAYPQPLTADRLASQIENATRLFTAMARWWTERAALIRQQVPPNTITPPSTSPPGVKDFKAPVTDGKPWLYYGVVAFDLGPDEALVIESELPDGPYWSFTLYNAWWESPDLLNRQTALNPKQTHTDADGRARFVIAHRDPGVPNWLDTGETRRGFLHYRWFRPVEALPTPICRLVHFDKVRAHLPAGHPAVTPDVRKTVLAARREQLAKRFQR